MITVCTIILAAFLLILLLTIAIGSYRAMWLVGLRSRDGNTGPSGKLLAIDLGGRIGSSLRQIVRDVDKCRDEREAAAMAISMLEIWGCVLRDGGEFHVLQDDEMSPVEFVLERRGDELSCVMRNKERLCTPLIQDD